jgi:heme/copper-type cytochrome/quinol oxidase subunit 3
MTDDNPTPSSSGVTGTAQSDSSATVVKDSSPMDYLTIEGMRGQEYSVGIFIFMLAGVAVFVAIILKFVFAAAKEKGLKKGEKVLFVWILLGTIGAVIFGGIQLLQGRLF